MQVKNERSCGGYKRVLIFDGLRVIAALVVMLHHLPALDPSLTEDSVFAQMFPAKLLKHKTSGNITHVAFSNLIKNEDTGFEFSKEGALEAFKKKHPDFTDEIFEVKVRDRKKAQSLEAKELKHALNASKDQSSSGRIDGLRQGPASSRKHAGSSQTSKTTPALRSSPTKNPRRNSSLKRFGKKRRDYQERWLGYLLLVGIGPGKIALEVFFVISGFLYTSQIRAVHEIPEDKKSIFISRYFLRAAIRGARLSISVVPVQMVSIFLCLNGLSYGNFNKSPKKEDVFKSYFSGLSSLFDSSLNGALWVLPHFIALPFVIGALEASVLSFKRRYRYMVYLLITLFMLGNGTAKTVNIYLPVFLGGWLFEYERNSQIYRKLGRRKSGTLCFRALRSTTFFLLLLSPWLKFSYGSRLSLILCAFCIVLAGISPGLFQAFLSMPIWSQLSPYTFQLYIWHLVVFNTFGVWFNNALRENIPRGVFGIACLSAYYALAFFVAFFVAFCGREWIEKRVIRKIHDSTIQLTKIPY